ncbi:hypothetical protein [Sphingobacterium bambusae]|uniref:Uncharacterized protein n=1 Tax=Sphingobacterium bambusae TaxID=662858 RepID=A0ABW6BD62_9SPHI|nr:hypothetical protein [Sphingobacterium bambusae]WPL48242.1 hypothetical protein SCB77_20040 [Sphingobacterium bambusae]
MRKKYIAPIITMEILFLESGIVTGSSVIKPGNPDAPFTPELDNWESNGSDFRDIDI